MSGEQERVYENLSVGKTSVCGGPLFSHHIAPQKAHDKSLAQGSSHPRGCPPSSGQPLEAARRRAKSARPEAEGVWTCPFGFGRRF